jgi:predicted secreted hydrolase
MADKMTPSQALSAQLEAIPAYLRPPADTYALMTAVAGKVTTAREATVIHQMLGVAGGYDQGPPPKVPLQFPKDHLMHLDAGAEWYWFSCHLDAQGPNGPVQIGILMSMERVRMLSLGVQQAAGFSDTDCQGAWNIVTVVVTDGATSSITRRNLNAGWSALGDTVIFPTVSDFRCQVGPDYIQGTADVLPLQISVDDGQNITLDISLSTDMPAEKAFFLQGGTGVTPGIQGVYYSYPQLRAAGLVTVNGVTYEAIGKAWIDHEQMIGQIPPAPFPPPAQPGFSGWHWCQFNFDDGTAYTGAAFQTNTLRTSPLSFWSFLLIRVADEWVLQPTLGVFDLDHFIPTLEQVIQPTSWTYNAYSGPLPSPPLIPPADFTITTTPWRLDGSFQTANLAVSSEVPVDAELLARGVGLDGALTNLKTKGRGYCESVSLEPHASYMARATAFLKSCL